MIYAVDRGNRAAFRAQLNEMYRLRRVHADAYGAAHSEAGLRDAFDTDDTVYLMGLDDFGRIHSALRLNPTTGPHLIRSLLPSAHMLGPGAIGEDIYEFTEYFVTGTGTIEGHHRQSSSELFLAMLEFGLAIGLSHVSLLCDPAILKTAQELQWRLKPLSRPSHFGGQLCVAMLFELSFDAADLIRKIRDIQGPVLTYRPEPPPYAANDNLLIRIL